MQSNFARWLVSSAAYVAFSMLVATVARGVDLDQLTSRSAISRAAAVLDRFLWAPYHWVGRTMRPPSDLMSVVTPALLLSNALAWGALLALGTQLFRTTKR